VVPAEPVVVVPGPAPAAKSSIPAMLGVVTDLGLPDGINLGLAFRPTSWARLHVAGGTNTASMGFRGGVTAIPYWLWFIGPSLSIEAGFYRVGDVNGVLRTFFQVPGWMKDYVQQAGYSYYNGHLGLEFGRGHVTAFVHGGGSYVHGSVHTPKPVFLATSLSGSSTNPAQLILAQQASVDVLTFSLKAGLIVFFGGP
jgi:hypothetical protein